MTNTYMLRVLIIELAIKKCANDISVGTVIFCNVHAALAVQNSISHYNVSQFYPGLIRLAILRAN